MSDNRNFLFDEPFYSQRALYTLTFYDDTTQWAIKFYSKQIVIGLKDPNSEWWTQHFSFISDLTTRIVRKKDKSKDWRNDDLIRNLLKFDMGSEYESAISIDNLNETITTMILINDYIRKKIIAGDNKHKISTSFFNFILINAFRDIKSIDKFAWLKQAIDNQHIINREGYTIFNVDIELAWEYLADNYHHHSTIVKYYRYAKKNEISNHFELALHVIRQLNTILPNDLDSHIRAAIEFYRQAARSFLLGDEVSQDDALEIFTTQLSQAIETSVVAEKILLCFSNILKEAKPNELILTVINSLLSDVNFQTKITTTDSLDLFRIKFMQTSSYPQQTLEIFDSINNRALLNPTHWEIARHAFATQHPFVARENITDIDKDVESNITANALYFVANTLIHPKNIPQQIDYSKRSCERLIESYKHLLASNKNMKTTIIEMNNLSDRKLDDSQLNKLLLTLETPEHQKMRTTTTESLDKIITRIKSENKALSFLLFSNIEEGPIIQLLEQLKADFMSGRNEPEALLAKLHCLSQQNEILKESLTQVNDIKYKY